MLTSNMQNVPWPMLLKWRSNSCYEIYATLTYKIRRVAKQAVKRFKENPRLSLFSFDWSGGITNAILDIISRDPDFDNLIERVVLVELGNEEYIAAMPPFHPVYGLNEEELVNRMIENMQRFSEFMSKTAPFLVGVSVREIGKHLCRLLMATKTNYDIDPDESWQITEALNLITDTGEDGDLRKALKHFGQYAMPSKPYFEKQFLPKAVMPRHEKELTTRALRFLLGIIDSRVMRATLGHSKPTVVPKISTEKGQMVLYDGHKMINQPFAQHFLIVEAFSQVMNWLQKREADDPANERAIILIDEFFALLKIENFSEWIGMISPLYRARAIELWCIVQGFWQLQESLREQIFSMGTIISFRNGNPNDAALLARLFDYDPHHVKHLPKTEFQNPTTESVEGQDRKIADWIQNLDARQFVMRQYITEQTKEDLPVFVRKTSDMPTSPQRMSVKQIKERLIAKHVPIKDALEAIKRRRFGGDPPPDYSGRKSKK